MNLFLVKKKNNNDDVNVIVSVYLIQILVQVFLQGFLVLSCPTV